MSAPAARAANDADPAGPADSRPSPYFNRELSWLAFNRRVLEEARNPRHPLLERLRFLSISGSNLDEFFMVRVAGLVGQMKAKLSEPSDDGLTPAEQLDQIRKLAQELTAEQDTRWIQLVGELAENGIAIVGPYDLVESDRAWLDERFLGYILPVLPPIPQQLDRFIRLPPQPCGGSSVRFISLENMLTLFLPRLFPGYEVLGQGLFRIIRDSD